MRIAKKRRMAIPSGFKFSGADVRSVLYETRLKVVGVPRNRTTIFMKIQILMSFAPPFPVPSLVPKLKIPDASLDLINNRACKNNSDTSVHERK